MTDQQPQLAAAPPRYANPQQAHQVGEKLAVQLDLLVLSAMGRWARGPGGALRCGDRGLLLSDGVTDTIDEGKKEGQVDGAGDERTVAEVQGREAADYAFDCLVWREEFGLCGHLDVDIETTPQERESTVKLFGGCSFMLLQRGLFMAQRMSYLGRPPIDYDIRIVSGVVESWGRHMPNPG